MAGRQPADHCHRHRRTGRGAGRRRVLVVDRPVHRPTVRRCGDGAACGPGAQARPAADDLQPGAVRCLRGGHPDRPGVPDVPRLHRHRHRAFRPGHRPVAERQRQCRHPHLRRGDRPGDGIRLPRDPLHRPDRQRARHHRVRLPVQPGDGPGRHRRVAGDPALQLGLLPARGVPGGVLADCLRPLRGRLLALPAEQHLIREDLPRRWPRLGDRRPGVDGARRVRRGHGQRSVRRP
ncbi:hypothetical protein FQZ97_775230 [compost metagenome]